MKKLLSCALFVVLISAVISPAAYAAQKDPVYPTIVVAGYSDSSLYKDGEKIWKLDTGDILDLVLQNIARIGIGLGELAFKNPDYLVDLVGPAIVDFCGDLACNPDGSSVYDLKTYYTDAEHTQYSYLYDNFDGENTHEKVIMADIADIYGENGYDYIFSYQHDFRMNMVDCAAELDRYIDSVLEFTGADKVNLFAVSHGGQTVAAYLYMFGLEKNVVNNAVLTVPAIGGAALAYDVMSSSVVFDEETLLYFIENGQMLEEDINWLVRANQFGILDDVCNMLMNRYVRQIIEYWGSIWDFIPTQYYEELKNEQLDPVVSADIIEKSDYFHYEILANMTECMNACVEKGMNIYIVAGYGSPSVTGLQEQSDAIIPVYAATGAKTAPFGSRFNDGYIQSGSTCSDPAHNHLSPDMTVDASAGFLPDYTWYVNGLYHSMMWKDPYCVELIKTLFFAKERMDVYSDPAFPQFKYACNRNYSVTCELNSSPQGYWTSDDTELKVTNLSNKYTMRLVSVSVDGADVRFDVKDIIYLKPLESCTLKMTGSLPEISLTTADITINYTLPGCVTPIGSRTMVYTIMNGESPEYNAGEPYAPSFRDTVFDRAVTPDIKYALEKTGLFDFLKMIINSLFTVLRTFTLVK